MEAASTCFHPYATCNRWIQDKRKLRGPGQSVDTASVQGQFHPCQRFTIKTAVWLETRDVPWPCVIWPTGPLDLVTSCRGVARTRMNPALAPITPHPPPPCATIMATIFFHLSLSPPCVHFEPTALGLYQERWSVNDYLPHVRSTTLWRPRKYSD
ncbi:hypothetical protein V8C43DRAFT_150813 [Trichoderma afarasin]